jgi:hypothetical protein
LPSLVRQLQADSSVVLDLQIGPTRDLLDSYDAGKLEHIPLMFTHTPHARRNLHILEL